MKVAVVEDHPLLLAHLEAALNELPDIDVVATAETLGQGKERFSAVDLDAVLLDINLPDGNGIGFGVSLSRENPELGVVFFSAHNEIKAFLEVPENIRSRWGYLTKVSTRSVVTIAGALRSSAGGEPVVDPRLFEDVGAVTRGRVSKLTARQLEVLRVVARGDSNLSIANELNISENAVGNHLIQVYETLGIPEGKNRRVTAVLHLLEVETDYRVTAF